MRQRVLVVAAFSTLALSGCGTVDPKSECRESMGNSYLPLEARAEWRYSVADVARDLSLGEKRNAVLETNGTTVKIEVRGATRPATRWLRSDGSRYEWLRNLYFDPETNEPASDQYYGTPALRFDASKTTLNDEWTEPTYTKRSIDISLCPDWSEGQGEANLDACPEESITDEQVNETWTVVAVDEPVADVQSDLEPDRTADDIPVGDVRVLCQRRSCPDGACINGVYCLAPGVGKVYELSSEREVLTSVCFPASDTE